MNETKVNTNIGDVSSPQAKKASILGSLPGPCHQQQANVASMRHANPHFVGRQRSAFELSTLLRELPSSIDLASADKRLQLEAAGQHAENYSVVLLDGLESLGRVMWVAAENKDWGVEQHDVGRLGTLISQMAIQLQFLDEFRAEVSYDLAQAEMKGARK